MATTKAQVLPKDLLNLNAAAFRKLVGHRLPRAHGFIPSEMPGCCGALILHSFSSEKLTDVLQFAVNIRAVAYRYGTLIATTVPHQERVNELLAAVGFKRRVCGKSNHGNYKITVWTWTRK